VAFPQGIVKHAAQYRSEDMKVVCFFAPPTDLENHRIFEEAWIPLTEAHPAQTPVIPSDHAGPILQT